MVSYAKEDFPTSNIRRLLEPGPIVLVSSAWKHETNIMSRECVLNIPTIDLAAAVVGIGNSSGRDVDKFERFKLTALPGRKVRAPLIKECHANFECRLRDSSLIKRYSLFVLEVVKAHVLTAPKFPKTLHYRGDGLFMLSGPTVGKYRKRFKPQNL